MTQLVWLITGCSSGFGEIFVRDALSRGDKVIATGRNSATRLAHLKETGATILDLDVTAPAADIKAKMEEAIAIYGKIDVLINNAGYLQMGLIESLTKEDYMSLLNTNLFGAINVTSALLPHFRSRKTGKIAFTSSIFSWTSQPTAVQYAISKHGLAGYAETLTQEVALFNISVIQFDIGFFRTDFPTQSIHHYKRSQFPEYAEFDNAMIAGYKALEGKPPGDPVKGVRLMVDILREEGVAKGKKPGNRIPIGSDAVILIRKRCEDVLNVVREWEDVSSETDISKEAAEEWARGLAQVGG